MRASDYAPGDVIVVTALPGHGKRGTVRRIDGALIWVRLDGQNYDTGYLAHSIKKETP